MSLNCRLRKQACAGRNLSHEQTGEKQDIWSRAINKGQAKGEKADLRLLSRGCNCSNAFPPAFHLTNGLLHVRDTAIWPEIVQIKGEATLHRKTWPTWRVLTRKKMGSFPCGVRRDGSILLW
ncbi:hypothetical protein RRG08_033464 [Elysia crispata]|uniref:Uncharacterized protein n=1 Tax=Elysia crispata TaxID=231223 RepID=A0AAE1AVX8_9GAST|nr:hypothetical protein RRG08_033464 [Elysia crispata]